MGTNPRDLVHQKQLQEHDRWENAHEAMRTEHGDPLERRVRRLELQAAGLGGGLVLGSVLLGALGVKVLGI